MKPIVIDPLAMRFAEGIAHGPSFLLLRFIAPTLLFLCIFSNFAFAKDYVVDKTVGEYHIEIRLDAYPMVLGDNSLEISIKDKADKNVDDAKVLVNYYMPPMPRMAPMNYRVKAVWRKKSYKTEMDIIMAGPWYIKIIFKHANKLYTTKFNVDAQ